MSIRDYLRQHPEVINAAEALEHAILGAAGDFGQLEVASKLGFLAKFLPVGTLTAEGVELAEHAIDGALNALIAPPGIVELTEEPAQLETDEGAGATPRMQRAAFNPERHG